MRSYLFYRKEKENRKDDHTEAYKFVVNPGLVSLDMLKLTRDTILFPILDQNLMIQRVWAGMEIFPSRTFSTVSVGITLFSRPMSL